MLETDNFGEIPKMRIVTKSFPEQSVITKFHLCDPNSDYHEKHQSDDFLSDRINSLFHPMAYASNTYEAHVSQTGTKDIVQNSKAPIVLRHNGICDYNHCVSNFQGYYPILDQIYTSPPLVISYMFSKPKKWI